MVTSAAINTTEAASGKSDAAPAVRVLLEGKTGFGDWRDDLIRDGYAVVRGAVPADRAAKYVEEMQDLLEGFNLGYKRDDPSTVKADKLPVINEKGMLNAYGVPHEQFVWDIRSEPGVIDAFAKVYGTDDLIVSFDAVNATFPNRTDLPPNNPWPHQDQDPLKPGFRCLQGLVNLAPNGSDDGGLMVCPGAHLRSEEYHREFASEEPIPAWTNEWYGFKSTGMAWLKAKGLEWVKVNAGPGDLIVWDSRAPHYNVSPTGTNARFATYTCYMPVADASQEDLIRKKAAFENCHGTSHWPNAMFVGGNVTKRNGGPDIIERLQPTKKPILGERAFKLTGIPYIKV